MRVIAKTPLDVIRAQEKEIEAKDAQLNSLGFSLAQEKAKNIQKDAQISRMGQELALMKFDILQIKGAVGK